jgi:signal transduction histidine kinase
MLLSVLKSANRVFISLWVALWMVQTVPAVAGETHDVMVLYSNDRLLPANVEGDRGLRAAVTGVRGGRVELFDEYLDEPRFGGASYEQTVATYLRDKYASRPPEIVMVGGEAALAFVLRNRMQLFPSAPVVHMGVSRSFLQSIQNKPTDLIGVPIEYDFSGTIDQALRWHPLARKLVVVTGASAFDRTSETRLRGESARLAGRATVEFLAGLPSAEVLHRLGELGRDAIVFTPGYFQDGAGRAFTPRESVELITAASAAPVYGPFNTFIGTGVVGGRMPTYESMGRQGGLIVNALIAGSAPGALKLPEIMATDLHVDWRQAQRWGIDEAKIPKDAILYFRAPSLWDAYRKEVIAGGTAILLLAGLSILLLTERRSLKRTTAALKASEQRMTLAARAARLAMWTWNVANDRISVEPLQPLFQPAGHTPINFADALAAVHPADRDEIKRTVQEALAANHELDMEYRTMQQDGEARWLAVRGRPDSGNSRQWLGVVLDITDRKQAQLQAEQDRTALRHMTRVSMLGQMSAAIAHQLNQPLAAILANAEAAQQVLRQEPVDLVEIKEICDDIVTQDQRAADVIRRLSALFKRNEMQIQQVDLHALLAETIELVHTNLITDRITLTTQLTEGPHAVYGDRIQLQQVLLNLIMNAADAMRRIPIVMRQLMICTEATAAEVLLRVTDHGPGIAPENLTKVFEPFWSAKPAGMGIGLAICQSIVGAHHGTLTVANNPDGGATFSVVFPTHLAA